MTDGKTKNCNSTCAGVCACAPAACACAAPAKAATRDCGCDDACLCDPGCDCGSQIGGQS